MTRESHIEQLREKHSLLDKAITDEAHRPVPDTVKMTSLKRQKLRIKDEIVRMQSEA